MTPRIDTGLPPDLRSRIPGSELDDLMAARDWAATPLGPVETWPPELRTVVATCLNTRFATMIMWGPELAMIYNDAYAPMLGAKHPRALGRPIAEVWEEVWPVIGELVDRVLATGEATWNEDLHLLMHRHGFDEETWFTFSYSPLLRADGSIGGVLDIATETTRQVLATRRLAALQQLGQVPAARLGEPVAVGRALTGTLAAARADLPFGSILLRSGSDDGVVEVASFGLTGPVPADGAVAAAVAEAAAGGGGSTVAGLAGALPGLVAPGGPGEPDVAVVLPLEGPGDDGPVGAVVLGTSPALLLDDAFRSFTELVAGRITSALTDAMAADRQRRHIEELAELDRAKTEFFTTVSHELRTPLALITGPTEDALADTAAPLPPTQRDRLELVRRNAGRLRRQVDALLDFAALEERRLTPDRVAVDPGALTRGIAESFAPAVERAGLALTVDCPDLPAVRLDPDQWERIVLNLLSNAVKYTLHGDVTVRLRVEAGALELTVADTGIGVPADQLPLLFRRFHRVRGVAARSHEGSGIGLALVRELAELHDGTASVTSAPGRGSTFTVRVPAVAAGGEEIREVRPVAVGRFRDEALQWTAPAAGPAAGPLPTSAPAATVLVADDNRDLRDYLTGLLASRYRVRTAADGVAALAEARREPPDLLLADVMMPGLDGIGLVGALRADPATATLPIILLSARAGMEAAVGGLTAGADDYLAKPFSSAELLARVRTHLDLSRARAGESRRLRRLAEATIAVHDAPDTPGALRLLVEAAHELLDAPAAVRLAEATRGWAGVARVVAPSAVAVTPDRTAELVAADGTRFGALEVAGTTADPGDAAVLAQLAEVGSAVLDRARLEHERNSAALTLQRAILGPTTLPAGFAVRYEPASSALEVGGDWYDVVALPDGTTGVVVGDVVGRGPDAAAVMGQLRSAARALLLERHSPADVLCALDGFAALTPGARCSTVLCAIVDPATSMLRWSRAGHLPAILADAAGGYRLLEDGLSVPLAVLPGAPRPEAVAALPPGGTLLLYTDGLVERRGEEVDLGIARAAAALGELAADPGTPVGDVLDGLTARLLGPGPDDDVAALVYRHEAGPRAGREVRWHYEPLPDATIRVRHRLVELLTGWGVRGDAAQDAELVLTELVANVVDHARTPFVVGVGLDDGTLRLSVRDGSATLPAVRPVDPLAVRGRGMQLVEALTLRWGHEGDGEAKTVWAELPAG